MQLRSILHNQIPRAYGFNLSLPASLPHSKSKNTCFRAANSDLVVTFASVEGIAAFVKIIKLATTSFLIVRVFGKAILE